MLDAVPGAAGASAADAAAGATTAGAVVAGLAAFVPLAAELCDLKRIRDARSDWSVACLLFQAAWGDIAAGRDVRETALIATGAALAGCRLGRIDGAVMEEAGLLPAEALHVRRRALDEVSGPVDQSLLGALQGQLRSGLRGGPAPGFVGALMRQPRAGATCPGKPRIVLEPPENHGDHCLVVAVLGCVLAPRFGADPAAVFLAGMAHHLHNAVLPDSGFAGEVLLGEHLLPVIERLFARELATLPGPVRERTEAALRHIRDASTAEGRAFHAADVIDRVLQIRHFEDVARFRLSQAMEDMDLVHAGPTQAFHHAVLRDAGLQ